MAAGWDEGLDLLKVLIWGQCKIPKNPRKKVLVFFSSLKVKMLIYCWKGAFVLGAYADVISYNLFDRFRFTYTWDSVFFYFWIIFQKFLRNCYFLGTRLLFLRNYIFDIYIWLKLGESKYCSALVSSSGNKLWLKTN